jgi:hypothetical protein
VTVIGYDGNSYLDEAFFLDKNKEKVKEPFQNK